MLRALDERVALDTDVAHLMAALPALARTLRYGDVRGTDVERAAARSPTAWSSAICVGLPAAVAALDDDAAAADARPGSTACTRALGLLDDAVATGDVAGHAGAGWPTATTCTACSPAG